MEVIIQPTKEAATLFTARLLGAEVQTNPHAVLGLATGRTMEAVYEHLVRFHKKEKLDFSLCRTFNLDEYVGLPGTSEHSYRYYMNHHLFNRVNVDPRNTYLPDGTAKDLAAECATYEENIARCGGVDLQLLGIGRTGHIGFNEPLSPLTSRTRAVVLAPATMEQNAGLFDRPSQMPRRAVTMGVGTILESNCCLLLATGAEKADILAKAVEGPVTSMISASALQFHQNCIVIVDEDAAAKLTQKDFYRSAFQHEPRWKPFRK